MAGPRRSGKLPARAALRLLRCRGDVSGQTSYSLLNCRGQFYSFLEGSLLTLLLLFGGKSITHLLLGVSKLVIPFVM